MSWGDLTSKLKFAPKKGFHTKFEMNTFKTVAKTHYPQNIAPLVDPPPGGRGGYDFKKLNPHPNGI